MGHCEFEASLVNIEGSRPTSQDHTARKMRKKETSLDEARLKTYPSQCIVAMVACKAMS